jgi:predicted transcriptional regulator
MERFYSTLFEVSNDYRHGMLLLLRKRPMRITEISKELELTSQEISRHASRLGESGLVYKDVEGFYHLTYYGELVHVLLEEFQFVSKHRNYFIDHCLTGLSPEFVKRIGDLSGSRSVNNTIEFLHHVDRIIKESKEYVWLQVDQYPLTSLGSIIDGQRRGVKFRVIEQSELLSGPRMNLESIEDAEALHETRKAPLSERTTLNETGVFMCLSENKGAVAFPTQGNKFDYYGFVATDKRSLKWCEDLFQQQWDKSISTLQRTGRAIDDHKPFLEVIAPGVAVVVGQDSQADASILQYAVDNYGEVRLRGVFDLGASTIKVGKTVTISGERSDKGPPKTRIYKRGWSFPFTRFDSVFEVNGKDADVIIENIHFSDFNCSCINGRLGRSLKIQNNLITLVTGYGRGWKCGEHGDVVTGIWLDAPHDLQGDANFSGGVMIGGNTIDFAYPAADALTTRSIPVHEEGEPDRQSELSRYEYFISVGINVLNMSGKVTIENNTILNVNGRGISVSDNHAEAEILIRENVIESDVSGSYPFGGDEAGVGVFAQSGFFYDRRGFRVNIDDNRVKLEKSNYTGVKALSATTSKGVTDSMLQACITNNIIFLGDGQTGIEIDDSNFEVSNNKVSGKAYFSIHMYNLMTLDGSSSLLADILIRNNDISELKLKDSRWWVKKRKSSLSE